MAEIKPTFQGEIQLAGWSESHNGGAKVTFWLPDAESLDAFRTLTTKKGNTAGHRLMAVLVEIGDDEQPVEPEQPKVGPLAYWLVRRCAEPEFWGWLSNSLGWLIRTPAEAASAVKMILEITSRKEVDADPEKVRLFHERIRGPYSKWCLARGIAQ